MIRKCTLVYPNVVHQSMYMYVAKVFFFLNINIKCLIKNFHFLQQLRKQARLVSQPISAQHNESNKALLRWCVDPVILKYHLCSMNNCNITNNYEEEEQKKRVKKERKKDKNRGEKFRIINKISIYKTDKIIL